MGQAQQESFDAVEGGIEGQPPPDLSHKRGHRLRQGGHGRPSDGQASHRSGSTREKLTT